MENRLTLSVEKHATNFFKFEVPNHKNSNQMCAIILCFNIQSLPDLYRRNVSESVSQVLQSQKVAKTPKRVCHLIDTSIVY